MARGTADGGSVEPVAAAPSRGRRRQTGDGRPPCFDCDELLTPPHPAPPPVPHVGREPTESEADEAGKWYRDRYEKVMRDAALAEVRALAKAVVPAFKNSFWPAVIAACVAGAVGFLTNVYLMAAKHDGFNVPKGSIVTGQGNPLWGPAFWGVASAFVGTIVGFRLKAGKEQFWSQVRQFPDRLRSTFRRDGDRGLPDLLWGMAGSLLVASFLPPSMGGIFAVGFLIVLGTALKRVMAGVFMAAWQFVAFRLSPTAPVQSPQTFEVAVLGTTLGLAVSYLVPGGGGSRLVLAVAAAGAAFAIRRGMVGTKAAALLVVVMCAVVLFGLSVDPAAADDGGYPECGRPGWWQWARNCGGSREVLRRAIEGGFLSFLGTLIGVPAGTLVPEMIDEYDDEIFGPEDDTTGAGGCDGEGETAGTGSGALKTYLRKNPDAPLDDSWLITRVLKETYKDYQSGDMIVRGETMARNTPDAIFKVLMDNALPIGQGMINAKEYADSGGAERDLKAFFNRPAKEVNRDIAQALINFQQGDDPLSHGVRASGDQMVADLNRFRAEYIDALNRNDQQALGLLHSKANANVGFQLVTNAADLPLGVGQVPFKGMGTGLKQGAGRLAGLVRPTGAVSDVERALLLDARASTRAGPGPVSGGVAGDLPGGTVRLPPVVRPRAEIEGALASAMEKAPEGSIVRVPLSPEEAEAFNVNRMTSLNLYETGLRDGTFVHMKLGEEYGPAVRAANPDGVFKPNSMGAKSLTPAEAQFLNVSEANRGQIYHYQPTALPPVTDPSYGKVKFRMDNWEALNAEMKTLQTKGGYGIDDMGNKYHYRVAVEPDGRVVMIEKNGQPVNRQPFIIDEDTADWGSVGPRKIALVDERGKPLLDANGQPQTIDLGGGGIPDDVLQSFLYKQSHGRIAGEGRTRAWVIDPADPKYAGDLKKLELDLAKKATTLEKLAEEGHVLIDGDGIFFCKMKPKKKTAPKTKTGTKAKSSKSSLPAAPKSIKPTGTSTRPAPSRRSGK